MHFVFHRPAYLTFGAGTSAQLSDVVREHGKLALIVTGGATCHIPLSL